MKALAALPCGAASLVGFGVGVEDWARLVAAAAGGEQGEEEGQPRAHGAEG